jgi:tetratricopeptide (TPR) repeat protein
MVHRTLNEGLTLMHHRKTRAGLVIATMVLTVLAGCNGPTKAGKEARSAANARMNIINAQVHFDQAKQSFDSGQFEKAQREIQRAITRYPDAPNYYVLQGRIFLETHDLEASLNCFTIAIDMLKGAVAAAPAKSESDKFKTTTPSREVTTLAEAHYFSGIVFQRWSDDEQSYQCYFNAFELEPTNAQYLLAAAESLIACGEFEQARHLIEQRLSYFEHNAALRQLQAQIALLQGDPKRAAALYAEARLLNPDDLGLLEQMMWSQYAAGQYGQCHETIKRLQETRARLASRSAPQPNGSRTTEDYTATRTDLMHLEARCLNMMGRTTEARELYIELSRVRAADAVVWVELGTLAWELGDFRRLAMCAVQLIALAPDRYEGYMFKGLNERQKGNIDEAVKLFQKAAQCSTDLAMPHLLLGQSLEQSGDLEGAFAAYQAASQVEPNSPEARELIRRLAIQMSTDSEPALSAAPTE